MSDFSYLAHNYDAAQVEEAIADLEQELEDEVALADTLGKDSAEKAQFASSFLQDNAESIAAQHARLLKLNEDLRRLVKENQERQAADKEFDELVHSQAYLDAADMMLDIKSVVTGLRDFLVKGGVRGRPPM